MHKNQSATGDGDSATVAKRAIRICLGKLEGGNPKALTPPTKKRFRSQRYHSHVVQEKGVELEL